VYYRSETDGVAAYSRDKRFIFTHQVAALCCVKGRHGRQRLCQSMRIYVKKILTKFHPNPIWNNGDFGFFRRGCPTRRTRRRRI